MHACVALARRWRAAARCISDWADTDDGMVLQRWLTPAVMMVPSKTIERRVHGLLRCAAVCREDIMSTAVLYRMATSDHLCPFGLKSKDLL